MFDIWSSIIGFLKIVKASRIATEVWVNPAALIIIPSHLFLEFWIIVTISPSTLDWTKSKFIFNVFALSKQIFLRPSKVMLPYCDCSLSPYRLRFGPLIIVILLFIQHLYSMKKINKIKITVNGKISRIKDDLQLSSYIKKLKIPIKKVAVELNEEIIDKNKLSKFKLKNNDKIEIVHFIGGG